MARRERARAPAAEAATGAGRFLWGTSGYSYEHWRDVFYPHGLKAADRLAFYATAFPAVELNVTYYRLPAREVFAGWRERTPDDFRFVLKGSRTVTHYRRLLNAEEPVRTFLDRARELGDKLEAALWQLPPAMGPDPARLDAFCGLLDRIAPHPLRHAFEFRHAGWLALETYEVLRAHGCALVLADSPGHPPPEVVTAPFTYLRFHAGALPDGGYATEQLVSAAGRARAWIDAGTDVYAFFNNDWNARAPVDASRLSALARGT